MSGSSDWPQIILRPGHDPLESLAVALAAHPDIGATVADELALSDQLAADERRLHVTVRRALHGRSDSQRVVVLIDQFEELFTMGRERDDHPARRVAFIDNLLHAAGVTGGQTLVLLTVRADFYGKCSAHARLADAICEHQRLVSPMSPNELHRAIERPALMAGAELEPGLSELLIARMQDQAGALPLMQHALAQLWTERDNHRLTIAAYRRMGGLEGALEQHAEAIFADLSLEQQAACQRIALRLTHPGEGTEDTKRRAARAEFSEGEIAGLVIQRLTDERLLTADSAHVEFSHEALLRGWSRLRGWLDSNRDGLRIQHRLSVAAVEWHEHRGDGDANDYLYRGARLAEIEEWSQEHGGGMSAREQAFVEASVAWRDRQQRERQSRQERALKMAQELAEEQERRADEQRRAAGKLRRRLWLATSIGFLALCATAVAIWSYRQARASQTDLRNVNAAFLAANGAVAETERRLREQLVATFQINGTNARDKGGDPLTAMHYFMGAAQAAERPADIANLRLAATILNRTSLRAVLDHQNWVRGARVSRDGQRILTWSNDHSARLWDARSGAPIGAPFSHEDSVNGAIFSRDEQLVLTFGQDHVAQVWDARTGEPNAPPLRHQGAIRGAHFDRSERRVLTFNDDHTAQVWDVRTGQPTAPPLAHRDSVLGATWSTDERRILTFSADHTARLWSVDTGEPFAPPMRHDDKVRGARFSSDDSRVLTFSDDRSARIWDAHTGLPVSEPLQHEGVIHDAQLSRDGQLALTFGYDNVALIWVVGAEIPSVEPLPHQAPVRGGMWSQDERQVLTWAGNSAKLWRLGGDGPTLVHTFRHREPVHGALWSADRSQILTHGEDRTARLWDAATGRPITEPLSHQGTVLGARFFEGDRRVITWSTDGSARVWDIDPALPRVLQHQDQVGGASLSADERRLLTSSADGSARVWDARTGEPVTSPIQHRGEVRGASWSEDGSRILTFSDNGEARLWAADTGEPVSRLFRHAGPIGGATLRADVGRLVTYSDDHTARIWDLQDSAGDHTFKHRDIVRGAVLSTDGRQLLTFSDDRTARVWDAHTGAAITPPLQHEDRVRDGRFSRDHSRILTVGDTARVWDARTGEPVTQSMRHRDVVREARLSRDESRILTYSDDGTARLWAADSGQPLTEPLHHGRVVSGALLTRDETLLITFGADDTVRLWPLPPSAPHKEFLLLSIPVRTGTQIDQFGQVRVMSGDEWRESRAMREMLSDRAVPPLAQTLEAWTYPTD